MHLAKYHENNKYGIPHDPELANQLKASMDRTERLVGHAMSENPAEMSEALQVDHGTRIVEVLIEAVHGYQPGSVEGTLLKDMAIKDAPSVLIEHAIEGLFNLYALGEDVTPAFLRFFLSDEHTNETILWSSMTVVNCNQAQLTSAEQDVYYGLVLDGYEPADAAEAAMLLT